MIYAVRTDIRKTLCSVNFLLSIIVLNVLIYATVCVPLDAPMPKYTIGEFIFKADRSTMLSNRIFSSSEMLVTGFSNQWLGIFVSFLTAFIFVPVFCDEYNSNCWRHNVERIGIRRYIASKLMTAVIVSFLLTALCFGVYAVICGVKFPDHNDYCENVLDLYGYTFNAFKRVFNTDSYMLLVFVRIFTAGLVTAAGGLFSLTLSAVTMNKYSAMALPVLMYFFFAQIGQDLMLSGDPDKVKFMFLDNSIRISRLEYIYTDYFGKPLWTAYIYFAVIIILLSVSYAFVMKRRLRQ